MTAKVSERAMSSAPSLAAAPATEHPAYRDFAEVVANVIAPRAVEVDATEVPRSHVDALREVGYFLWLVPSEHGGSPVPPVVKQAADDLLFGACPSTALAVTQHGGPIGQALKIKTASALALLPDLAAGRRIGSVGFSQIRAWPSRPSAIATKAPGGYRFNGLVTYLSGWGLADTGHLGAVDEQNATYVFGIADLNQPGITGTVLRLAAVQGSRTAALTLEDVFIPDDLISEVTGVNEWNALDGITRPPARRGIDADLSTAEPPALPALPAVGTLPAVGPVGLARAALTDARSAHPDDPSLRLLSEELERAAITPRPEPYWRAQLDELAVRATAAALVAKGGGGLQTNNIAQVRARAALFLQVRGLSPRMRTARFELLAN